MLTSSANQYLRPEYLTPLPTTLDAKKSPLALLAQTCSQIGADSPSAKPLIPALEKPSKAPKSDTPREKSSPTTSSSSSASSSGGEPAPRSSFKPYEACPVQPPPREKTLSPAEDRGARVRTPVAPAKSGRCGSNHSASSPRSSPAVGRKTPADKPAEPAASKAAAFSPGPPPADKPPASYLAGYPPPFSPAEALLQHKPYLGYARMKTPAGGDTLVAVCRDPYCTGCQLSSQLLAAAAAAGKGCPGGCAQCDHAGKLPGAAAAAAYAHAQLAALAAASQLPYVCSWVGGDATYCGKRFAASDELLQHLRTHTAASEPPPPAHPLFHRTYPTPPLSPLATARYHPYGKPLLPPSLGYPLHPHPGLPPYFSPYSLYGQRLGAAMHP
ncbi:zinc finger protein Noc-like [Bacillus rossius redtenbacheri]|uniref:zinc finger protein Noc-like n=1 Tax=Bacillus rossius redtenbacheri TaxID=93214 RepID=UPI002FDCD520